MRVESVVFFLVAAVAIVTSHTKKGQSKTHARYDVYKRPLYPGYRTRYPQGNERCGRRLNKRDCPMFNLRSDSVRATDFIEKVMSVENGWIVLLAVEVNSDTRIGKCRVKYNYPVKNNEFVKAAACYNLDKSECNIFYKLMRLTEDDCGRAFLVGVNVSTTERIYSQDLNMYFWRDSCVGVLENECRDGRNIYLNVKADRYLHNVDRTANITSLPWEHITADLRNVFGRKMIDPEVRHAFLGPECEFS